MNGRRSKHPDLIDLEVVRGSSKFEEGISGEREEILGFTSIGSRVEEDA